MLRSAGWVRIRQSGSHETWQNPDATLRVTVAGKDSDTVPTGTVAAMRRATGMVDLR
jgi:predicted RNA binding protein YcfA (HicA-like mRNA interferase family)